MKKSPFYKSIENGKVMCELCPHYCKIAEGKHGICIIRKNINSELYLETYGKVSAVHFDPIEKKPLYHFYPGRITLSIGGIGCSFRCKFCQNWEIAQASPSDFTHLKEYF